MTYKLNQEKRCSSFLVPSVVADEHLLLAGALQLRVLLYCCSQNAAEYSADTVATALNANLEDVNDALMFWKELGVFDLVGQENVAANRPPKPVKIVAPEIKKPNRSEVARRGLENKDIANILAEAQIKFGRTLKQSESSLLVWLYDDMGMSPALIFMVLEYAIRANKCNIGYIEKVAKDWLENGVTTVVDAENRIIDLNNSQLAWNVVRRAFGLENRAPSETEMKFSKTAVLEWKYDAAIFKKAYDVCVDNIGKYRFSYIKTVLTKWHKSGVQTAEDVEKLSENKKDGKETVGYGTYDLSAMDQLINGD